MKPVCRNIGNNQLYYYNGNDEFENIITGKKGIVGEDKANKVFKFNVEATQMMDEYPVIEEMIKTLNLKFNNENKK